jgi:hypothetical protein
MLRQRQFTESQVNPMCDPHLRALLTIAGGEETSMDQALGEK